MRASPQAIPVADLRAALDAALRRDLGASIQELQKRTVDLRVYVTDARGIVLYDSDSGRDEGQDYSRWHDVYWTLRGSYGARASRDVPDDPYSSVHYVAAPIRSGGRIVGALSVGKPVRSCAAWSRLCGARSPTPARSRWPSPRSSVSRWRTGSRAR